MPTVTVSATIRSACSRIASALLLALVAILAPLPPAEAQAPPDPVTNIQVTHNGSSLTVTWDASARATHYDVTYYRHDNRQNARAAWNRAGTSLTIRCDIRPEHLNLYCVESGSTYTVGVRARNAAGESGWVNSAPVPPGTALPDAVASVMVFHYGGYLIVSWDASARATHYDVTYYNTGSGQNARAAWDLAGTRLTITCDIRPEHLGRYCVDSGATYTVGVRAKNAAGASAWRNSVPASMQVPPAVDSVNVVHNGSSLSVSWDAAVRAASYHVTYSGDGGQSWSLAASEHAGTSLTISGVDGQKTYTVAVRARNIYGESPWRNSAPATQPPAQESVGAGYPGQLGEVLVELSLQTLGQGADGQAAGVFGQVGIQSSHTTSIVYVVDDSTTLEGDFPEVRQALRDVRSTAMANTKVALVGFGGSATTVQGLTDHSATVWTNTQINAFSGKLGDPNYNAALRAAKALLDADTTATTKKIIFMSNGWIAQGSFPSSWINALKAARIVVDAIAYGDHPSNRFANLRTMAADTGGTYRAVAKPSLGTTNTPAVTAEDLADVLKASVAANTATLFLFDYSHSVYFDNQPVLHPALTAAATKAGSTTGAKVGLARFLGEWVLSTWDCYGKYKVLKAIGSTSLTIDTCADSGAASTDIDHALSEAYNTITHASVTETNKRVVLISDGISAVDVQTTTLNNYKNNASVTLDVVAWGKHADRVKLKGWATTAGSGNFKVAKAGPPPPLGLSASVQNTTVTLTWNNPNDAAITKYQVRQWKNLQGWSAWMDIASSGATTVTHQVTGLTPDCSSCVVGYGFQVRAFYGNALPSRKSFTVWAQVSGNARAAVNSPTVSATPSRPVGGTARRGGGRWSASTALALPIPNRVGSVRVTPDGNGSRQATSPDDPIIWTGTSGPDEHSGAGSDDELYGLGGNDVLRGLGGDDELMGGRGDDVLLGGPGDDELVAGSGNDDLTGGAGADRFVFSPDEPGDKIITDFSATEGDMIVLNAAQEGYWWPPVVDIVASVVAQGTRYTVYTLYDGLTVETDVPLRAEDFVRE